MYEVINCVAFLSVNNKVIDCLCCALYLFVLHIRYMSVYLFHACLYQCPTVYVLNTFIMYSVSLL